jgi:hypothetical protein
MHKLISITVILVMAGACSTRIANAQPVAERATRPLERKRRLLRSARMATVPCGSEQFPANDINEINEQTRLRVLRRSHPRWHDERQVFDPAATGGTSGHQGATSSTNSRPVGFLRSSSSTKPARMRSTESCSEYNPTGPWS